MFDKPETKPLPDLDEKGRTYLTERYLREICHYNSGYSEPQYNTSLVLNYLALRKIENLESYSHIRVLHLENNCITKIEGISHIKALRHLFLHNNQIEKIEGLEGLTELATLNLSSNNIKTIEGLDGLYKLENFYIEKNKIEDYNDIKGLAECRSLNVIGLQDNLIVNNPDEIVEFFASLPHLGVLYLTGNEIIRKIPNYRKTMINKIRALTYLDNKPVDEGERIGADAFFEGGLDAERKARKEFKEKNDRTYRIRRQETEWVNKESFEERRDKALYSLNVEFTKRKEELNEKRKRIVEEMLLFPEKKAELSRQLLSIEYQLKENESFKKKEEEDIILSMSKREEVNKYIPFKYEEWMYPIFYERVIENAFNFSAAVKIIHHDLKAKNVDNYQIFNELDLRSKWTEFEIKRFRKEEFDFAIYNMDPKVYEEKIDSIIKEGTIEEADFENTYSILTSQEQQTQTQTPTPQVNFEELD